MADDQSRVLGTLAPALSTAPAVRSFARASRETAESGSFSLDMMNAAAAAGDAIAWAIKRGVAEELDLDGRTELAVCISATHSAIARKVRTAKALHVPSGAAATLLSPLLVIALSVVEPAWRPLILFVLAVSLASIYRGLSVYQIAKAFEESVLPAWSAASQAAAELERDTRRRLANTVSEP